MTWPGHLFRWLPCLLMATMGGTIVLGIHHPSWLTLGAIPFSIYILPLLLFRMLQLIAPVREGVSDLRARRFSSWWAGHQLQAHFIGLPWLETPLRLIPGMFSWWLRAWGSHIGRRVYWTPLVEIVDRNLLDIGDDVVFGHRVVCVAHVIKPRAQRLILYVRRIRVGSAAFLSADVRLGPGSQVEAGSFVPFLTDLFPNQTWPESTSHATAASEAPAPPLSPAAQDLLT